MRRPATAVTTAAVAAALMVATVVWWQRPATGPSLDDPEIARAVRETRFALGLVGALGRRAALDEVLGRRVVAPAVDGVKAVLLEHRGAESSADGRTESQPIADKGVDG